MALFSRKPEQPGALRDCTPGAKGMKKFSEGDVAVIDAANISRHEAQTLVDLKPSAVINLARAAWLLASEQKRTLPRHRVR